MSLHSCYRQTLSPGEGPGYLGKLGQAREHVVVGEGVLVDHGGLHYSQSLNVTLNAVISLNVDMKRTTTLVSLRTGTISI